MTEFDNRMLREMPTKDYTAEDMKPPLDDK